MTEGSRYSQLGVFQATATLPWASYGHCSCHGGHGHTQAGCSWQHRVRPRLPMATSLRRLHSQVNLCMPKPDKELMAYQTANWPTSQQAQIHPTLPTEIRNTHPGNPPALRQHAWTRSHTHAPVSVTLPAPRIAGKHQRHGKVAMHTCAASTASHPCTPGNIHHVYSAMELAQTCRNVFRNRSAPNV